MYSLPPLYNLLFINKLTLIDCLLMGLSFAENVESVSLVDSLEGLPYLESVDDFTELTGEEEENTTSRELTEDEEAARLEQVRIEEEDQVLAATRRQAEKKRRKREKKARKKEKRTLQGVSWLWELCVHLKHFFFRF